MESLSVPENTGTRPASAAYPSPPVTRVRCLVGDRVQSKIRNSLRACFLLIVLRASRNRTMLSPPNHQATLLMVFLLGACATNTVQQPPQATTPAVSISDASASRAADNALAMLGKPYRHSGNTPAGFDCSGLVQYSYSKVGVSLPRATQAQRHEGEPVNASQLRRGDLLFFDQEGKKSSHVGIYIGHRRFVHAPSTGGRVRTDGLDAAYWRTHFIEARRL